MKAGRKLSELAAEIKRQRDAKQDYKLSTNVLTMDAMDNGMQLSIRNDKTRETIILNVNEIAHNQIGQYLGIPAKYYDRMRSDNPELLAENVNSWFHREPDVRTLRTLDGTARAFLSDRYRLIDNYEIADTVIPIIADIPGARVESCEITEQRMYIKVVNPRLTKEVVPGDIVQSGLIVTNSEVGLGSMTIQPLVYRLVCRNGMVVNDARTRKYHIGRGSLAAEDFTLYSDETLMAEDRALMMKVRDTVRAVVDQTRFDRVVKMMQEAKKAKIETKNIPDMVELIGNDFGYTKTEGEGILDYLIRGGELSLYGLANATTRFAQDVGSYDRSTALESVGYSILSMPSEQWHRLNALEKKAA